MIWIPRGYREQLGIGNESRNIYQISNLREVNEETSHCRQRTTLVILPKG